MKRAILLAVLFAQPALAQSYQDSDWLDGSIPSRSWVSSPTIDTGAVSADAFEPADVADSGFTEAQWITATDGTSDYLQTGIYERKFRMTCEPGTAKILDPILYNGQAEPVGHRHQGTGNVGWDQNSTFTTLRASPSSTCTGGPLNGTIYWEPEMLKALPSGAVAGIRPQVNTFYYINGIMSDDQNLTWLRRNFGFIGGADPTNYNDTARRAEYAAAGFEYPGSPQTPAGFYGWQCFLDDGSQVTVTRTASQYQSGAGIADTGKARHLKAEDGSDPWGGNCTGSEGAPALLIGNLLAPDCWDAHNLRAPDGRGHVAYSARKPDNSVTDACPDNWAHVPQLEAKTQYNTTGFADYGGWYLSSDRMNPAGTAPDPTSLDPCRQTGPYFCNGSTYHFDYIYGWKDAVGKRWQRECLGITIDGVAPTHGPAGCNTSQISKFEKLLAGGASPDSTMSGGCATILSCSNATPGNSQRYNPLPSGTTGDFVIEHNH